jgi:hypothetical protein
MNGFYQVGRLMVALLLASLTVPDVNAGDGCLFRRLKSRSCQPRCCQPTAQPVCTSPCVQKCEAKYAQHMAICERFKNNPDVYARCRAMAVQGHAICLADCQSCGSVTRYRTQMLRDVTPEDCDLQHSLCVGTPAECNDLYFSCMEIAVIIHP